MDGDDRAPARGRLNDDDIDFHFPEYDGRWSRQTRDALTKFSAGGLELNTNWALTRQKWSCEGCWNGSTRSSGNPEPASCSLSSNYTMTIFGSGRTRVGAGPLRSGPGYRPPA
jgi:hypothetical protein